MNAGFYKYPTLPLLQSKQIIKKRLLKSGSGVAAREVCGRGGGGGGGGGADGTPCQQQKMSAE